MEHILVVDDDTVLGLLLKISLERQNFQVHCVENIHDGLALAQHNNPILAIVDLRLPFGNGFTLIERFRSDPQFEKMSIIILSADVTVEAQEKAEALNCPIFAKPLPYSVLMESISNLVANIHFAPEDLIND